eukprot:scaffold145245_cov83-Attheya_sp.AAC.2
MLRLLTALQLSFERKGNDHTYYVEEKKDNGKLLREKGLPSEFMDLLKSKSQCSGTSYIHMKRSLHIPKKVSELCALHIDDLKAEQNWHHKH